MKKYEDYFWNMVETAEVETDCWVWLGNKNSKGYGKIRWEGKGTFAHRVSYEITFGAIPKGMQLDHKCHNPACVNPNHLRIASNADNQHNVGLKQNNTSGYKGVSFNKKLNKWVASIRSNLENHYLGYFATPEEAHLAYCEAAKRLHGEFANFGDSALSQFQEATGVLPVASDPVASDPGTVSNHG